MSRKPLLDQDDPLVVMLQAPQNRPFAPAPPAAFQAALRQRLLHAARQHPTLLLLRRGLRTAVSFTFLLLVVTVTWLMLRTTSVNAPPVAAPPAATATPDAADAPLQLTDWFWREIIAAPGGSLQLTVVWRTVSAPPADYSAFVHLFDENGRLVAQVDQLLGEPGHPTTTWTVGEEVTAVYDIPLPADLTATTLSATAGYYDLETGQQLASEPIDLTLTVSITSTLPLPQPTATTTVSTVPAQPQPTATTPMMPFADCPITRPPQPAFVPPAPYPATPPSGQFWWGGPALWTAVHTEGVWDALPQTAAGFTQKIFWWAQDYETFAPADITLTARRLDDPSISFSNDEPTNGYNEQVLAFMLTGVTIPTPGCWEFTGHYQEQSLSFTVWVGTP